MTLNRQRSAAWDEELVSAESGCGWGRSLANAFWFVLFLAGATLVFGVLAVRTAGFRELAAARIQEWTQTRVHIRGSRIAWPYDVMLTELSVPVNPGREKPALWIPELRVCWRPFRGLAIRLSRPTVRLVEGADGRREPEELMLFGDIRNAGDIADWLESVNKRASVRIEQGTLEVVTSAGETRRRLESIDLDAVPVVLPGRRAVYFRLRTGGLTGMDGQGRGVVFEWLKIEGVGVRELVSDGDAGGLPGGRDLWKGTLP